MTVEAVLMAVEAILMAVAAILTAVVVILTAVAVILTAATFDQNPSSGITGSNSLTHKLGPHTLCSHNLPQSRTQGFTWYGLN
ncbi:hypothetical protein Hdeb2414_s0277g00855441 [Helianthus debilis subsp. tardiflorus]